MIKMIFTPIDSSKKFVKAASEYKQIWEKEKNKIVRSFKKITSLEFKQKKINALIYEGPSRSGTLNNPMKLRASYSPDIKLGTLIHELGHRLLYANGVVGETRGLDEEQCLFLFLYDVWVDLYGEKFAKSNVDVESGHKGIYDYKNAWTWALAGGKTERVKRLEEILEVVKI